jgi:2-methylcitrate dehydratase PrpD
LPPVIAVANGVQAFGQFNKVHRALLKGYSFGGKPTEGKGR